MNDKEHCFRCGLTSLDVGWECTSCGHDNFPYYSGIDSTRPSIQSLWRAFWSTPCEGESWSKPVDRNGQTIPVNALSFKYEVVRMAFELDEDNARES